LFNVVLTVVNFPICCPVIYLSPENTHKMPEHPNNGLHKAPVYPNRCDFIQYI